VKRIYLAGAVDGQPDAVVLDWRHAAQDMLATHGLDGIVPPALGMGGKWTDEKIVRSDLAGLRSCDAVLANVTLPSFGTGAELLHAWMNAKPIVAYRTHPGPVLSAFVRFLAGGGTFPTLGEAVVRLAEMFPSQ
jgi:nucleoside 2-deoxyribosyltransferase